jgi:hypothetical protein
MDDQRTDSHLNFNGLLHEKGIIVLFFGLCLQYGLGQCFAFLIRMTLKVKVKLSLYLTN